MLLYKYCRAEGLAILRTGKIRLCRPKGFNDPFDANPHISKFDDVVRMNDYMDARHCSPSRRSSHDFHRGGKLRFDSCPRGSDQHDRTQLAAGD
jgi:hypothetical protein